MELALRVQLVAPHGWGNPAGRVGTVLVLPWRELGVEGNMTQ